MQKQHEVSVWEPSTSRQLPANRASSRLYSRPLPTPLIEGSSSEQFYQPGKWRLILDLSSPYQQSVNDEIPWELCSMRYIIINDTVEKILSVGQGCLLVKLHVEHAHRNIPVHPDDRPKESTWIRCYRLDWGRPKKSFQLYRGVSLILHYLNDFFNDGKIQFDRVSG